MTADIWQYLHWAGYLFGAFATLIFVAHLPILPLLRLIKLSVPNRGKIALCFIEAWLKNCLTIIPDILAPVIVPLALVFTPRSAEKLPWLFTWWDNDASINGDGWAVLREGNWVQVFGNELPGEKPVSYLDQEYTGDAYYCRGYHPRSFYARWTWLGLRNRASRLSQILGFKHDSAAPVEVWRGGDIAQHNYWSIHCVAGKYRYYEEIKFGNIYVRLHYGYKVPQFPDRAAAQLVAIGFSLRKIK